MMATYEFTHFNIRDFISGCVSNKEYIESNRFRDSVQNIIYCEDKSRRSFIKPPNYKSFNTKRQQERCN